MAGVTIPYGFELPTGIEKINVDLLNRNFTKMNDALKAIDAAYKSADTSVTNAYKAADTAITNAYKAADTDIRADYKTADTATLNSAKADTTSKIADFKPGAGGSRAIGAISAGGSAVNLDITFPSGRFSATPGISLIGSSSRMSFGIQSISSTGATFTCSNFTTAQANAGTVYWVASQ